MTDPWEHVDLIAVIYAVEPGDGWTTELPDRWRRNPGDECPGAETSQAGPVERDQRELAELPGFSGDGTVRAGAAATQVYDCPPIGPLTLVLNDGARLDVAEGTPGDPPCLLQLAGKPVAEIRAGYGQRHCVAAIGRDDAGIVEWVDVWSTGHGTSQIGLRGGPVVSLAENGTAITESGLAYTLSPEIRARGCGHLLTSKVVAASADIERISREELYRLWDGPDRTRLMVGPWVPFRTMATIDSVTCSDLEYRMQTRARRLWESIEPFRYRFQLSRSGGMRGRVSYEISVSGDRHVVRVIEEPWSPTDTELGDIDWVFDKYVDDEEGKEVEFNPQRGYPESIRSNPRGIIDGGYSIRITDFQVLALYDEGL